MSFLHPAILVAGLLAVAIPILIHLLLRRRRQPVEWAAMRFLLEAYRKRRRKLTLEQMLLLVTRCLLVALLGAALAAPVLGGALSGSTGRLLVLLVDDSIVSGTQPTGNTDLSRNLQRGAALLDELDATRGDRIAIVALAAPARAIIAPATADLDAARRVLQSLEPNDAPPDWDGALGQIAATLAAEEGEPAATLAMLSSWRAGTLDPEFDLANRLPERVSLVHPVANDQPALNVAITAVTPDRRVVLGQRDAVGGLGRVTVELHRSGVAPLGVASTSVRVSEGVTARPLGSLRVDWAAGETTRSVPISLDTTGLESPSGRVLLRAEVDADALPADDVRFAAIESRGELNVALLGRRRQATGDVASFTPTDWAALALSADETSGFATRRLDPESATRARLAEFDAVLVPAPGALTPSGWDAITWFVTRGGLALFSPGSDDTSITWADGLSGLAPFWTLPQEPSAPAQAVGLRQAADRDPLLGVVNDELSFLLSPVSVTRWVSPRPTQPGDPLGRVLLETSTGEPWLIARTLNNTGESQAAGTLLWMSSPLDLGWSDLPARPLLVPLLQELLRQGIEPEAQVAQLTAGDTVPASRDRLRAWSPETQPESVSLAGDTNRTLLRRGTWLTLDNQDRATGALLVHPATAASDTTPSANAEVTEWLERSGVSVASLGEGTGSGAAALNAGTPQRSLGWIVLTIVLALALLETWLARRVSHVEGPGSLPIAATPPAGGAAA